MPTDATGTPTSLGIRKYNTSADAPSGLGFNGAMDDIDALLLLRVSKPAGIASGEVPVWNGTGWDRSTTTKIGASSLPDLAGKELGYAQITAPVSIISTTEGTPTPVVSAGAIPFDGTAVIVEFYAPYFRCNTAASSTLNLYDVAAQVGRLALTTTATFHGSVYARYRLTPSVGSHTYNVGGWNGSGTADVGAGATGGGAYMPAFIRISKV